MPHSAPEKKYIVESFGGGVALFDFDNDGLVDIYFVDSLTVATASDRKAARSALYKNLGSGRFADVSVKAGVAHPGWGLGVCTADVDGDGWEDLYVTTFGRNRLYRNNQDGTFTDIAEQAGVTAGGFSAGCGFADYDRDGDLDLFVSRYVKLDLDNLPEFGKGKHCEFRGIGVHCGPRGLPGSSDLLFRNDGKERFSDVSEAAGVTDTRAHYGLGVAWLDVNDDGWLDLYVANDLGGNYLYVNRRDGTFREVGYFAGVAVSKDGMMQGSMGVAVGDLTHDGALALFVTNYANEYNALYRPEGGAQFTDVSVESNTAPSSMPYVGWGTAFFDYDNDGEQDLVVVNGHVYPQLDKLDSDQLRGSAPYRQRMLLYHNRGDGTFDEIGLQLGPPFAEPRVSRGLAVGDLNNDGRPDLVVNDLEGPPQILDNRTAGAGHWLIVKLTGRGKNTDAIGAVIKLRTGSRLQVRNVRSGTSYLSQDDMRQHFGLGQAAQADSIEILWPDGTVTRRDNVKADQIVVIEQKPEGGS